MSFLAPYWLFLGAAAAVPLVIHLLRRRIGARVDFPAARYLARAEREHSRTLRIRNLLLMFLRVLALVAVALAAARPVGRWAGAGHTPTALAVVVDNSMSAGLVVDGHPLLDRFKTLAKAALGRAAPGDRVWLVSIDGQVRGGTPAVLRDEVDRLVPIAGAGDPAAAVSRAASLVRGAGLGARQIALLTDGQRTEWQHVPALDDVQLLLYTPAGAVPANRAVTLAEARPARWTPRGAIAARIQSPDSATYRITLANRTLSRGTAAPGEDVIVHAEPADRGWVSGTVELEPDELPADNVRWFAVWIGAAPGVSASPGAGAFAQSAVDVLRASERVVAGQDIGIVSGDELTTLPALIVAPSDPVKIGAANRALQRLGVAWRFGARVTTAATVQGAGLDRVTVASRYQLAPQAGAAADTLAAVGRDPWIVAGDKYVLIGSPLTPDATSFPVSASFVPWIGDVLTERLVGEPGQVIDAAPGAELPRPRWADAIESAGGQRTPLGETLDVPTSAGVSFLTRGDHRVGAVVVNPPAGESRLDRYGGAELRARLGDKQTTLATDATWASLAFRAASRRALVGPLLLAALVLILVESLLLGARPARPA